MKWQPIEGPVPLASGDPGPPDESGESEFPEDELVDDLEDEAGDLEERERNAALAGWGTSLALHALVMLILGVVAVATSLLTETPPVRTANVDPPPPPPEEDRQLRELTPTDTEVVDEVEIENPLVTQVEIEVEEIQTEEEEISEISEVKGRKEAKSSAEAGGAAAFLAMGGGGASSGAFGNRSGSGKKRALGRYGGSRASESAVESALRWFKRHQSPSGMWDVDGYPINCTVDGPKCEPGKNQSGWEDAAITGYALLCFLGAGYDHKTPNKYQQTIKRGLRWLVETQDGNGKWDRNYENGICTMALAEAYAMTTDPSLREPTRKGVRHLIKVQNPGGGGSYGGSGWGYENQRPKRNDSSVSGWCVMALKSAKAAGIEVGSGMDGAKWWLERAWKAANPRWKDFDPYKDRSVFPYTYDEVADEAQANRLACVGALCAVFLGHQAGDLMLETLANEIMHTHFPKSQRYPTDTYYMYYNTLAIFQLGGERWRKWNGAVRDMLVGVQRRSDDCFDGSWDPIKGSGGHRVAETGRTLVTAYCTLSLEVYYRYVPIALQ